MPSEITASYLASIFTILGAVFTIVGVVTAVIIYYLWKKDYKSQQAHIYALNLLAKIKTLHFEIEILRRPKFHNPATLANDIINKYIPQIEENILKRFIEIQVELLTAEKILIVHKDIQSLFNSLIRKNIIHKINTAVYIFYSLNNSESPSSLQEVKKSELFEIIFPSEIKIDGQKIKRSTLGTDAEVINDAFNNCIENNFQSIYSALEKNLI